GLKSCSQQHLLVFVPTVHLAWGVYKNLAHYIWGVYKMNDRHVHILKEYAVNLTDYWDDVFQDTNFSLKINIIPYIDKLSAIEVVCVENQKYKKRIYEVKKEFVINHDVYDMKDTSNGFIYFGYNSFLVLKPICACYWSKNHEKIDNAYLINEILL